MNTNNEFISKNENVDLLFGLSPSQIYYASGLFYEFPRMCSVALMEILEVIQENQDNKKDVSSYIDFSKSMNVLVDIERAHDDYDTFFELFDKRNNNSVDLTGKSEAEIEAANNLHKWLVKIVGRIDEIGFTDFANFIALSISDVKTKQAYEDMVYALAFAQTFYIAYIKNLWSVQMGKQLNKEKLEYLIHRFNFTSMEAVLIK